MNLENVLINALLLEWEESELGWGIRPDGYSLHLSKQDAQNYVADYWKDMPKEVPEEYSRPCYPLVPVKVTSKLYLVINENKNGIRFYSEKFNKYIESKDLII